MSDFDFDEFGDDEFSEFEDNPFGNEDDQFSAFEMQVESKMSQVLNSSVSRKERIAAIYWLGESGAPKAIPVLRRVYGEEFKKKKKKDKELFQASEYALGQFKALDLAIKRGKNESVIDALGNPENEHIMDLLQSIALSGVKTKSGGSSPVLPIILTLSLIILIGMNVVLGGGSDNGATKTPVPTDIPFSVQDAAAINVLNQMDTLTEDMSSKIDTLQAYYTTFDCTQPLIPSIAVSVPPDVEELYPNIDSIGLRLETTTTFLNQEITNRQTTCTAGGTPETAAIESAINNLNSLDMDLVLITTDLAAARNNIVANYGPPTATPIPTEGPSPTPSDTPTPTISPTPTIAPSDIRPHTIALSDIINNLDVSGGPIPLLEQYWADLQTGGTTQACNGLVIPPIPENYDVGNADLLAYVAELATAQEKVNFLLDNLRTGWSLFELACQSGDPTALIDPGIAAVGVIQTALTDARAALVPLQQMR